MRAMGLKRKIFVVDDHSIMRWGYIALINQEMDLEVCGEAGTALDALEKIAATKPDLAIIDISLDGMNGIELTKHLQALQPELPVLIVSMHDESLYGERALRAGAKGYIMKREARTRIVEAIRRVLNGSFYLSDEMSTKILLQYQGRRMDEESSSIERLSDRELEVFELFGRGFSTREIAESLLISPKTVESHRNRIKTKLAVDSTSELLQRAVQWVQMESIA
ncbi:MAG: response regulator transcription factor [Rhodothermales bacterium]